MPAARAQDVDLMKSHEEPKKMDLPEIGGIPISPPKDNISNILCGERWLEIYGQKKIRGNQRDSWDSWDSRDRRMQ